MAKYSEASESIENLVVEISNELGLINYGVDFQPLCVKKAKEVCKLVKANELVEYASNRDDLVFVLCYEDAFDQVDEKTQYMWLRMEMEKVSYDTEKDEYYKACGFEHIFNYLVLGKIFISHYELKYRGTQEEKEQYKILKECNCEFLVHGHIHNKPSSQDDIKRLNVCVDYKPNNFTPIYNETLSNYIQERLKEEKWAETLLR